MRLTRNKYNAIRTEVDGIKFDSLVEGEMYQLLIADKDTIHVDVHVPVTLPGGIRFKIDFIVWKKDEVEAIEAKGYQTNEFKRMRKLFDAFHPLGPMKVFGKVRNRWVSL